MSKAALLRTLPKKATPESMHRRMQIAAKLRERRKRLRFTMQQAALLADVSEDTWSRWETGLSAIPLEVVHKITAVVGNVWLPDIREQLVA